MVGLHVLNVWTLENDNRKDGRSGGEGWMDGSVQDSTISPSLPPSLPATTTTCICEDCVNVLA